MKQNTLPIKNVLEKLDFGKAHSKSDFISTSVPINKTVEILMDILFEKSGREMYHSKRVSDISQAIAVNLNLDSKQLNTLSIAATIHDIGKIEIDKDVLNKKRKFEGDEWKEIMKHPRIGYDMLRSITGYDEIAKIILQHHEWWDGSGYPNRIKRDEILIEARIIAISDAFDSITSPNSYRKKTGIKDAALEIKRCAGTQFDPDIVRIFVDKVNEL